MLLHQMKIDLRGFCCASVLVVIWSGSSWLRVRHMMYVAAELTAISAAPAKPRGCKKQTRIAGIMIAD
jgi:hypothetical protein